MPNPPLVVPGVLFIRDYKKVEHVYVRNGVTYVYITYDHALEIPGDHVDAITK